MVTVPIINSILTRIISQSDNPNRHRTLPLLLGPEAGPDHLPYALLEPD